MTVTLTEEQIRWLKAVREEIKAEMDEYGTWWHSHECTSIYQRNLAHLIDMLMPFESR